MSTKNRLHAYSGLTPMQTPDIWDRLCRGAGLCRQSRPLRRRSAQGRKNEIGGGAL